MRVPRVLTIAGSDPSGGAGIQGDIKTLHQHGVYAFAVPTLLTVQSTRGVSDVHVLPAELVSAQTRAVLEDLPPDVIKLGALGDEDVVRAVASALEGCEAPLVVDPVIASTSGASLLAPDGVEALVSLLFARATLVTPNAEEAARLSGVRVETADDAAEAARVIARSGARAVLVKGGHLVGAPIDVLWDGERVTSFAGERIETRAGHGTGCALSSAIAARLARGEALIDAVSAARAWVAEALARAEPTGRGRGPIDHFTVPTPALRPKRG